MTFSSRDLTVHKFIIPIQPDYDQSKPFTLQLPVRALVLKVAFHPDVPYPEGKLCLWAIVDPNEPVVVPRNFYVIGTGRPLPATDITFIDTVFYGREVYHLFEERIIQHAVNPYPQGIGAG
jgi:hypothetical protein